jgi:LytS/YehU family sensor histidine kinase
VPISTELEFIEDYIKLEQIRFHFPINIEIDKSINNNLMIPPMLLIPLVENTFKHGLKNDSEASKIEIKLSYENNKFRFRTKNKLYKNNDVNERTGTGLKNLGERLLLLYKDDFVLDLSRQDENFIAELIIPAHEN